MILADEFHESLTFELESSLEHHKGSIYVGTGCGHRIVGSLNHWFYKYKYHVTGKII